ncbi:MAG TPA: hypothetical protein PKK99_04235 [Bacteroidia bacterium]|nr:hypothetical protein [Bacteroidia bacterium]HNP98235.1 hypothetical protein [Bacteroidia bacterium]
MKKIMMNAEGKAVVYQIQVETKKSSDELIFEEVWIDEKRFKIKLRDQEREIVSTFQDKQVVNLDIAEEAVQDETSSRPKEILKSKVLVGYSIGNKRKFLSISKFDENDENYFQEE